jgi:hypothetical protein
MEINLFRIIAVAVTDGGQEKKIIKDEQKKDTAQKRENSVNSHSVTT